ncbi:MAG: hypothetical protein M1819_000307 [Sarea resinae]|nr:MAG: hypothetical protein M1819_000307 [Sarea resinae]
MAAATQGYTATPFSDTLPTPGFFTAALAADEGQNPFEASCREENAKSAFAKDPGATGDIPQFPSLGTGVSSPFSFSPKQNTSGLPQIKTEFDSPSEARRKYEGPSLEDMNVAPSEMWNASRQEDSLQSRQKQAVHLQNLSPPQSSSESPPDKWNSFQYSDPTNPSFEHLLSERNLIAQARFGNVTPPEDNPPKSAVATGAFDYHSAKKQASNRKSSNTTKSAAVINGKRKGGRWASHTDEQTAESNASKRPRKASTSNRTKSDALESTEYLGHEEDDAKRSKFLERNRVAASKCRQKKKEWTGNLEARARDLQNAKNQLSVIASSLRDEVLYLKGEMLKHSSCNCASIREYLNREVTNIANADHSRLPYFGHGPPSSRISSMPNSHSPSSSELSRRTSILSDSRATPGESEASSLRNSDLASGNGTPSQLEMQGSPSFKYREDDNLHALLSAQLAPGGMGDAFAMRAT